MPNNDDRSQPMYGALPLPNEEAELCRRVFEESRAEIRYSEREALARMEREERRRRLEEYYAPIVISGTGSAASITSLNASDLLPLNVYSSNSTSSQVSFQYPSINADIESAKAYFKSVNEALKNEDKKPTESKNMSKLNEIRIKVLRTTLIKSNKTFFYLMRKTSDAKNNFTYNPFFLEIWTRIYDSPKREVLRKFDLLQNILNLRLNGNQKNQIGTVIGIYNGRTCSASDLYVCGHCGTIHNRNSTRRNRVFVDAGDEEAKETWCNSCVNTYAFYCQMRGEWYSKLSYTPVIVEEYRGDACNARFVCMEVQLDCGTIYQWANNEWHDHSEEESRRRRFRRLNYHSANWDRQLPEKPFYCIELEVQANNQDDLTKLCMKNGEYWYGTCDGSLDCETGVELVVRPILHANLVADCVELFKELPALCKGHLAGSGYGMHVNISKRAWGIDSMIMGKMLVLTYRSKVFLEMVAQRKENRWAAFKAKTIEDGYQNTDDKYEAINVRGDRVEFRIFRSNTRIDRILKNCQMVAAMIEFCKTHELTEMFPKHFSEFIQTTEFTELKQYLTEKDIKEAPIRGTIKNENKLKLIEASA